MSAPLSYATNDFEAQSWQHLQDLVFRDTWDARLGRYRSPFVYRGMRSFGYTLSTSLQRLGGNYHELEHHPENGLRFGSTLQLVSELLPLSSSSSTRSPDHHHEQ